MVGQGDMLGLLQQSECHSNDSGFFHHFINFSVP